MPRIFANNEYGDNYLQAEAVIAKLMHHYNENDYMRHWATAGIVEVNRMKFEASVPGE
jgi:hypothetical protein